MESGDSSVSWITRGLKRTTFLGILNDFAETRFVRIFRRKCRNDQLARLSQRSEFARNSRNVATIDACTKLYETEKLDIRCLSSRFGTPAMNFLGGMTTQDRNGWEG